MFLNRIQYLCNWIFGICAGNPVGDPTGHQSGRGLCPQCSDAEVYPVFKSITRFSWVLTALLFLSLLLPALSPAADLIINNAWFNSNEVNINQSVTVTVDVRTPSTIELLKYFPLASGGESVQINVTGHSPSGSESGPFSPMPVPTPFGSSTPFDLSNPLTLHPSDIFHVGEPLFLRVTDLDQNQDPTVAENVVVTVTSSTGDSEVLLLTETGPDSGIFTGYLESNGDPVSSNSGTLSLVAAGTLAANYHDKNDGIDSSATTAMVDPFGIVLDSSSGSPVDGVTVTLIDATTGLPATVMGDDGSSSYPATVTSGATTTDSGGTTYTPPTGGFRFPLVAPGIYRLEVIPVADYLAPSVVSTAEIQRLPGAPFSIVTGSRGEDFSINLGPMIQIDIPLDPESTGLWIEKNASKNEAAIGDFIAYLVTVENFNATGTVANIKVTDTLPLGFSYQKGSTRIDGDKADNPKISSNGRTLTFNIGDLSALSSTRIVYVVEVAAGTKTGERKNTAIATGRGDVKSNTADAVVNIREEFLRSKSLLMGRVMIGGCEHPDTELEGLKNAKIYLEDGTYVVTDDQGKYHFEGIDPGTHVVQLDLESLPHRYETITCEDNTQFAGRNFSQFIDLQGGTMWRADFHVGLKAKSRGKVSIELNGSQENGHTTFRVPIEISQVSLSNLRLKVQIPQGLKYIRGSSRLDETETLIPEIVDGSLIYRLNDRSAGWKGVISLQTMTTNEHPEELSTRALLTFNSPEQEDQQTPAADNLFRTLVKSTAEPAVRFDVRPDFPTMSSELSDADKVFFDQLVEQMQGFEIDKLYAIGHSDNVLIAQKSWKIFQDNFALSAARARNVAKYLAEALHLPPEKVISVGVAGAVPVADNKTEQGRSLNRRVELRIEGKNVNIEKILTLIKDHDAQMTETLGLRPGQTAEEAKAEQTEEVVEPLAPGILYPHDNEALANRIASVRINLDSKLKARLTLDGEEISADQIGFKMVDPETGQTLYTFIGINFGDKGNHLLKLEGIGPFGNARFQQEFTIIRTGEIAEIRVIENGDNVADGITPISVRVQLFDSTGQIIRAATKLPIIDGNLNAEIFDDKFERTAEHDNYVEIDAQGYARFQPTQKSGQYHATLSYGDRTVELETYVKPEMRDWIMVGFAEGTAGYNTLSGNQMNLDDANIDEHFYEDDRVKFFAKGAIKGEWLLTMAYDSDKKNRDAESLEQIIDPNAYYPLYGDETQQDYDAASARKIFVKLERDQFYALFGDMQTGLTKTELSRYSRSMNGFKSELQSKRVEYTVYAAETRQAFKKDEIRGNGTSGRYYLSQRDLVINSEEVVIEIRDRFRSENIISTQTLQRYVDYTINYHDGSLFFRRPIASKDASFNPIFIVVDYETKASDDSEFNYGGRAAVKLLDQKVEIGATHIHEKAGTESGNLYGVDATVDINEANKLHLEAASTDSKNKHPKIDGDAWLAELEHSSRNLQAKFYYRQQDGEFGLGQQNGSESGTRKYGTEGNYHLSDKASISALAWHEDNLDTDAERDVMELSSDLELQQWNLNGGFRAARDTLSDGSEKESLQLLTGANWTTSNKKLTLRANHEQSLGGKNDNSSYPTLSLLGADYHLNNNVSLFAEQEFTWGDEKRTEGSRVGLQATPWRGGTAQSSIERQIDENSERMFALFGLDQVWQITEHWSVDAGIDRSQTIKDTGSYEFNSDVPAAHGGTEDFTAVSMGATYEEEKWSWANRVEFYHADTEDKYNLFSDVVGQLRDGLSASAQYTGFYTDRQSYGRKNLEQELRLGLAFRPTRSRWIILNRLDAAYDKNEIRQYDETSWRLVNNLHANFKANRKWQFAPYYGLKYVRDNFDGAHFSGFTDLMALETRYNFDPKWDLGLHGSVMHSWNSNQMDYSTGASIGHRIMTNTWVSVGYNFEGFRAEDFSSANYTAQGVFVRFRVKFDQQSVKKALGWLNVQ